MSFSALNTRPKPALAVRLTMTLGLIMLAVGALFSAIYFVLSVSLFSRLANQQLDQKAKSAEVILKAVGNSRESVNSMTYIRNLQNAGFSDSIAVYSDKWKLVAHSDEGLATALGRYATDTKLKLPEVEEQNKLLQDILKYRRGKPASPFYTVGNVNYIAYTQDNTTVLLGLVAQKPKLLTLAASFFILCLLAAGINTLFVYHYGHSLAQSLAQIVRGLDVDSLRPESIDAQYQEVDALLHTVDERIRQTRTEVAPQAAVSAENTAQLLQNKLFEKPFPRMQQYELAVYPRRPRAETHEFISGAQDQGHVDVLIGVTESDQIDALVVKHRLQERFWALAKANLSADDLARNLWSAFFAHSELVPGIFFGRLDEAARSMDIYRAGGVHLFEVTGEGSCNEITLGSTRFGSEYTGVAEHRLTPGSHLVMVSHDAFSAMELSAADFAEVLSKLGSARSGKILLAGILEKIHQKLPAGETVPGLLAVLSEKK
ncbi:MAG TPA: hypothetical protein PKG67_10555 [Turneriella sp.]|nr:hypothetical protein [Turneriella sp.]